MIARILAAALAGLAVAAGPAHAADPPPTYGALLDEVWKTVDGNFYDPTFHGQDWRAIGDRYRAKLPQVADDVAFARLANAMLGQLKASHLYISPPVVNGVKGGVGIGAEVEEIDGQHVVIELVPMTDAQRQGLRVGDRIANPKALTGSLGARTTLQVTGCDGVHRAVQVRHERALWPPRHPGFEWRAVGISPTVKLGYIRIDRFDDGAAALADQAMEELRDTQGIVIDIRRNTGGNLSALRLASYFMGESRAAVALLGKPYLAALGRRVTAADIAALPPTRGAYTNDAIFAALTTGKGAAAYYSEDLGPKRYAGKVLVLMGRETASAGEGFAALMRDLAVAPLVGRPTAGYLLSSDRFTLSGGWRLTVPVDGVWAADGRDYGDKAIQPDVALPRTAGDLCRADDPDLAKAADLLTASLKP